MACRIAHPPYHDILVPVSLLHAWQARLVRTGYSVMRRSPTARTDLPPHPPSADPRLAPLSEGRIHESGQLQCTYHGWRWDASGACTSIPQIPDEKAHAVATASPRACVKNYPTQVRGLGACKGAQWDWAAGGWGDWRTEIGVGGC
jgi:nitrite reductase/ring-hydroxylating ferredoxin subunit